MSMDIKQLLKTAIDAKIGGDQKGFNEAMKQVMAAKVGSILAEDQRDPYADQRIEVTPESVAQHLAQFANEYEQADIERYKQAILSGRVQAPLKNINDYHGGRRVLDVIKRQRLKGVTESFEDAANQEAEGEYFFNLEEYDYNGTLVDAGLSLNIGHYQAPTQGNFSPTASDPSEYHGDPEEVEWYVVSAKLIMEDGTEQFMAGEEAAALSFNDREQERITEYLLGQIQGSDDDVDYDRGNRGYDY